jgi:dipeptidyl aminopeptidase/acylaminoacyl peptidase
LRPRLALCRRTDRWRSHQDSPNGDRPFLDRFNLATGKAQRLFQSSSGYENFIAILDETGTRILTRRESPAEPPNYYIRVGSELKPLTNFANPTPQTARVDKQLVNYKRSDGVPLSVTLYLPKDYKPGTKLPGLVWCVARQRRYSAPGDAF